MDFRIPLAIARSHKVLSLVFLTLLTTTVFFTREAGTQSEPERPSDNLKLRGREFVAGEVLVRFRSEAAAKQQTSRLKNVSVDGLEVQLTMAKIVDDTSLDGLRLVRVKAQDTLKTVEALRARTDVLYAEPNYLRFQLAAPNDPLYKNLWGLHNTGSIFDSPGLTPGIDIDAERAWNITTGSRDVVVGVIDGGIDVNHVDLQANIWKNPLDQPGNGIDEDGNGFVDDHNGFDFFHNTGSTSFADLHATHVAGTIGAVGNNSIGVVGVNWEVSLMSLKILGGEGEALPTSNVALGIRAYDYARKMRELWISSGGTKGANIRVLNASFGGYSRSQAEADSIKELSDAGILFVAAAGNDFRNNDKFPLYPAGYDLPNIISVAASGFGDLLTGFSNVGTRTVHMSAPGITIQSTTLNSTYGTLQGTSMAAPHVAGAAALICAAHPDIDVRRLRASLIYNGDFVPGQLLNTLTARRLNVFNSLNAVAENDNTPPAAIADFRLVVQNGRSLTLGWRASGDDGNTGTSSIYDIRFSENDLSSAAQFDAATTISPLAIPFPSVAGSFESATVEIPLKKTKGFIGIRTTDNMGNNGPIAVLPVVSAITAAQLYDITESAPEPLSTGGTQVPLGRTVRPDGLVDEAQLFDFKLPFEFPFYGYRLRNVNISANGTLYFSPPPKFFLPPITNSGISLDFASSIRALQTNMMIAGMWDDLIVNVFTVIPDPDRFIVRWQGVTFDTKLDDGTSRGEAPISCEIELRKNGTIVVRYGNGNEKLFPVVGISGGNPEAYVVGSHTSESTLKTLANANTVTFTPRFPPVPTKADLQVTVVQSIAAGSGNSTPLDAAVLPGQILEYSVVVENLGPDAADNVVLTAQMPAGTSFVGCVVGASFCTAPPPGANVGLMSFPLGTLGQIFNNKASGARIQVKVNDGIPSETTLTATFTASSAMPEVNPANNSTTTTTLVGGLTPFRDVLAVDGERTFSAAVKKDGTVWFWGIPPGSPESASNSIPIPRMIDGLSNITAIAVGTKHILALKSDGTVWSWGRNDVGQLGIGAIDLFQLFPARQIPGLQNVQSIATGGTISLALKGDGTIWGWGDNGGGILTGGAGGVPVLAPLQINTIAGVRQIASGGCTYAIKQDGTVWSWRDTFFTGQCGTGHTEENPPFAWLQVNGISDVRSIKSRFNNTIAVKNDGSVWTWGNNSSGQLGTGTFIERSSVPLLVTSLNNVQAVGQATTSDLALKTDGTVWFWGNGQSTPKQVTGLAGVKNINAWSFVFAAIMSDDTLQMWGDNGYSNLGNGIVGGDGALGPVQSLTVPATPVINPDSRLLVFQQDVVITCQTPGAIIHYTTNGADPTQSDPGISSGGSVRISKSGVLKARAFKSGLSPSRVTTATYVVLASDPGSIVEMLLDAEVGQPNEAAAIDSALATRGPFSIVNNSNLLNSGADPNTRVIVFTRKFQLLPGEAPNSVMVELYDANGFYFQLLAEDVRSVPNTDLTQVTFRLSDNLAPGKYTAFVRAHGQTSNAGSITISP